MGKRLYKSTQDTFLQRVGERIQHYRTSRKGLTQEQLAGSINSNSSYISKVENGQAEGLTVQMLKTLADALGVPPSELLDIESGSSPQSEKRVARLLSRALSLNERDRIVVLNVLEAAIDGFSKHRTS
jgi:transcriptional regulator with XRE-family HTH domain